MRRPVPVQELWLYSNQLASVPRELAQLTGLKRLWLDRNQLTSVPAELAQLTNLQVGPLPGGSGAALRRACSEEARALGLHVGHSCTPCRALRLLPLSNPGHPKEQLSFPSLSEQELYLDQNPGLQQLPPALALLPALRRMYVASTPEAQAALQAQAQAVHQMPGGLGPAAAAVAAGVIMQSRPFT